MKGKGVPKSSIPFTSQTSFVNASICSPFQSNCIVQCAFTTNAKPNTSSSLGSYLHRSHWLKFIASSHQILVTRLNGRHRGTNIGTAILILIDWYNDWYNVDTQAKKHAHWSRLTRQERDTLVIEYLVTPGKRQREGCREGGGGGRVHICCRFWAIAKIREG